VYECATNGSIAGFFTGDTMMCHSLQLEHLEQEQNDCHAHPQECNLSRKNYLDCSAGNRIHRYFDHTYFIWGLQPLNRFWNVNLVKVATSKIPMGRDSILPCYIETVNVQLHSMQGAAGKPHIVGSFSIVYSYSSFQNPASICLSGFQRHIPHPFVMIQAIAKT
jgi:hypothetical protein